MQNHEFLIEFVRNFQNFRFQNVFKKFTSETSECVSESDAADAFAFPEFL